MENNKSTLEGNTAAHVEDAFRRGSITQVDVQSHTPVWESRRTHTKTGIIGLFSSRYVSLCALFATLGGLLFGYDQGVVSITLVMPQFLDDFPGVSDEASGAGFKKGLMTAVLELGAFLGAMNQGWIADKISRKWSIFVAGVIFLVGAALQTGAVSFAMLTVARLVGGVGVGMLSMVAPLYISEIAPPEIRGTLLVLQELCIVTGIVIAFYITYGTRHIPSYWSWRLPFLIQMIPAVLMTAGVFMLPYSPRWLCQRGRNEEGLRTLAKIRELPTTNDRVLQEWYEIRSECTYRHEILKEKHSRLMGPGLWNAIKLQVMLYIDCWKLPVYKRTQVAVGLMFFQQFVGINALIYYSPNLFQSMGLNYEMRLTMSGVMNICQVVACVWSLWVMDSLGRRKLLLEGSVCMFIAHFLIAVLVGKYSGQWADHTAAGWACVAFLLFFMLAFGATWGPIPWAIPAEIFPSSLRAKGCAFGTMSNWGNNFIIGLITPPMIQNIGFGTYVFFCSFCAISFVWVYFLVPETNGRTLEEMDSVFKDQTLAEETERRAAIMADLMGNPTGQEGHVRA
ncbi:general substrate transporter [Aspergillus pseudocaelatus]|uniref:General substrate transporter n=1 Tax=Aspergillus pseudocaelatus TaxID=1825620 RepID=A0ABQ6X2Q2_9EURO|nr:general substrate transporter [Aspergillus pseudocaelatus]